MARARGGVTDPAASVMEQPVSVWKSTLRSVLTYAVVATVWIFTSDLVTAQFAISPQHMTTVSIIKGIAFVWVTSALLFVLVRNDLTIIQRALAQQLLLAQGASALRSADTPDRAWADLVDTIRISTGYDDAEVWLVTPDGDALCPSADGTGCGAECAVASHGHGTDTMPPRLITHDDGAFEWLWGQASSEAISVRRVAPTASVRHPEGYSTLDVIPVPIQGSLGGAIMLWSRGRKRLASLYGEPISHLVAQLSDTVERMRLRTDLQRSYFYDDLTGLPNQALLVERMQLALQDVSALGEDFLVLVCQIDLVERVQQSLGHDQADKLIAETARRLEKIIGERDTLARSQTSEFTIIGRYQHRSEVADYLARLDEATREPVELDGASVPLSVSTGVYIAHGSASVQKVMSDVASAIRRAHELGRGRTVFFDEGMRLSLEDALKVEVELRDALRLGQFELAYQPIVTADSQQFVGAEALVRWNHPTRGLIGPAGFIPVAEDSGLIVEIGRQVIRAACRECATWPETDSIVPYISVNLSAIEFLDPGLEDVIRDALSVANLDPARLVIEITETTLMLEPALAREMLTQLRATGIRVAVDDFGTGYSSLAYLQQFELDTLKIDATFVANLPDSSENCAIASAIIQMAHALNLRTTAEGVETHAQAAYLAERGCDELQGYLIGRPMLTSEYTGVLAHLAKPAA